MMDPAPKRPYNDILQTPNGGGCSEARVGGMLSGKAGLVHIHTGAGLTMLEPLRQALAVSDVPITQFLPTHMDRNTNLLHDGLQWMKEGGCIDFTAGARVLLCAACAQLSAWGSSNLWTLYHI